MKFILAFGLILSVNLVFAQKNQSDDPKLYSYNTSIEHIGDFELSFDYYPLKRNMEKEALGVYAERTPTLDEIAYAAMNMTSELFVISKDSVSANIITFMNDKIVKEFAVATPSTGENRHFKCSLKGQITENRANELIKQNYDPKASIDNGKLTFNKTEYVIITNEKMKEALLKLITKEGLTNEDNRVIIE